MSLLLKAISLSQMQKTTKKLPTAGLLTIRDNKLLLAFSNNKKAWYLPGGKIDAGETSEEALIREVKEELGVDLNREDLRLFAHISAPAYGEIGLIMEQDCFLYPLLNDVVPGAEIGGVRYFSRSEYSREPVRVEGVIKAFDILADAGLFPG